MSLLLKKSRTNKGFLPYLLNVISCLILNRNTIPLKIYNKSLSGHTIYHNNLLKAISVTINWGFNFKEKKIHLLGLLKTSYTFHSAKKTTMKKIQCFRANLILFNLKSKLNSKSNKRNLKIGDKHRNANACTKKAFWKITQ